MDNGAIANVAKHAELDSNASAAADAGYRRTAQLPTSANMARMMAEQQRRRFGWAVDMLPAVSTTPRRGRWAWAPAV